MTEITDAVDWITRRWPHLQESRLKGTPRPWRQQTLTPQQRAAADRAAREELDRNGGRALGESPAPVHLDAVDLSQLIIKRTSRIAADVATDLGHQQALTALIRHRPDNPSEALIYTRHWADKSTDEIRQSVLSELLHLRDLMGAHFQEILDGQHLEAYCPWCDRTQMYVRLIGPEATREPVIICQSGQCNPPQDQCGTWYHGNPAWPFHEWAWLADRISTS